MNRPPMDHERIAALMDGRLEGRDRDEALASLAAADDDALGAYADAAAVLRELEAEDAAAAPPPAVDAKVIPFRRRARPGAPLLALAAGLAAVALGIGGWWARGGTGPGDPGRYAARLEARGIPTGWNGSPWAATRAADAPLAPRARAVRLGARLTDLEVAAAVGDAASTRRAAAEAATRRGALPAAGPASSVYAEVRGRAGEPAAALAPLLARGRRTAARLAGEEGVALGAWAEAARLAAARHDAAFFRARESRAALGRAARMDVLPAEARAAVGRLQDVGEASDWAAVERDATALLAAAAR